MKFRDILAIATSGSDDSAIAVAGQLAQQNGGRLSAFLATWMPPAIMAEGWVVSPVWGNVRAQVGAQLQADLAKLRSRLEMGMNPVDRVDGEALEPGQYPDAVAIRARHCDVTVVGCASSDVQSSLVEAALFGSGRPLLLAPPRWKPRKIGHNIVVAWKPTREAARALAEADDLAAHAHQITVVRVDTDHTETDCQASGGAIAAHLERRGLSARSCVVAPIGRSEARSILDHAEAIDADLIVMGGFGRSRMSEFIFGGMTREIMRSATIPVLLAH